MLYVQSIHCVYMVIVSLHYDGVSMDLFMYLPGMQVNLDLFSVIIW